MLFEDLAFLWTTYWCVNVAIIWSFNFCQRHAVSYLLRFRGATCIVLCFWLCVKPHLTNCTMVLMHC